jgi:hypothetical protein
MNESVFNKERKKERKNILKGRTLRTCLNFYLSDSDEDLELLDRIETLRHRDRWSITRFLREAVGEYVGRHLPGNPIPILENYPAEGRESVPFSVAAKEKLAPKPPEPDYKHMTVPELEAQLKRRFLSEADCMVIRFWIGKKQQETQTK